MKPMLARTLGPKFAQFPCFGQRKLNGVRALYQQGSGPGFDTFQSRDEKIWKFSVLEHLSKELQTLKIGSLILDGELYKHGWRLQQINGAVAVNRLLPREDTKDVEFHVFDVVNLEKPFSERYFEIYHLLKSASLPHIKPVETILLHDRETMLDAFHLFTREGYEGIMLRPEGFYEFGEHRGRNGTMTEYRSRTLWKHKQWEDGEFRCVDITQGEGKAEIGVGALILTTQPHIGELSTFHPTNWPIFGVGTGLTDQDRIEFAANPPIGKLVRVRYLCLTEDGIPFNPSFLAVL